MTDEELDLLYNLKQQFHLDFYELVNTTIEKVPSHLQDYLKMMLRGRLLKFTEGEE